MALSRSQQAAKDTGHEVDQARHESVVTVMKTRYMAIRGQLGDKVLPPAQNPAFDRYISTLADEVIAGETSRALEIRQFMETADPEKYKQLQQANGVRIAATKTSQKNTGDFEFLGGSTIMNAIAGLFQWLFKGCKGGFAGLKEIIATRAVASTMTDFKKNLQEQGINPQEGFGQEVVSKFEQRVQAKAGLIAEPSKEAFDLSKIEIVGYNPKAEEAPAKPVEIKNAADVKPALEGHFKGVAEGAHLALRAIAPAEYHGLLDKAKGSLVKKGVELTEKALVGDKRLPENFKFQVIRETFRDAQSQVDSKDEKSTSLMKKIMQEFDKPGATLQSVNAVFAKSEDTKYIPILNNTLANALDGNNGKAQAQLLDIMKKAQPQNKALETQASNSGEVVKKESEVRRRENLQALKTTIATELHKASDPDAIEARINEGVKKNIEQRYPTDSNVNGRWKSMVNTVFVGDTTATLSGMAPWGSDRKKLADFMSGGIKAIVGDEMNKVIDNGKGFGNEDVEKVVQNSLKRFNSAFDGAIGNGTLPNSWKEHKSMVMEQLETSIRGSLDGQKSNLDGVLKTASNDRQGLSDAVKTSLAASGISGGKVSLPDGHFVGNAGTTPGSAMPSGERVV